MTSLSDTSSAKAALAVTPADDFLPGGTTRALWVGGDGNLSLMFESGVTVTITGVLAGTLLPVCVKQVKAATTASNIVALY